eukprot:594803-Hanusia_phi.AAC.1
MLGCSRTTFLAPVLLYIPVDIPSNYPDYDYIVHVYNNNTKKWEKCVTPFLSFSFEDETEYLSRKETNAANLTSGNVSSLLIGFENSSRDTGARSDIFVLSVHGPS